MASAGWGGAYASNPFAQQAAAASAEQAASAAADKRQSGAFGAWGAGVGSAPTAAAAPEAPSNVFAHAVPAVNGGGGMSGREAELQRREAELAKREAALAAGGGVLKVSAAIQRSSNCHFKQVSVQPWQFIAEVHSCRHGSMDIAGSKQ
jgi:hypothetical protein